MTKLNHNIDHYLIVDDLGLRRGMVFPETDIATSRHVDVLRMLGECRKPVAVYMFNPGENRSCDVTEDFAIRWYDFFIFSGHTSLDDIPEPARTFIYDNHTALTEAAHDNDDGRVELPVGRSLAARG